MFDSLGCIRETYHGFEIIEFSDCCDKHCSLQRSPYFEDEPKTSAILLGRNEYRMHLKYAQVKQLIKSLQKWVDNDSFK